MQDPTRELDRLCSLLDATTEAIFCFEYPDPIPVDLAQDEQVERMFVAHLADCNDIAARAYGYESREEALGKSLRDLLDPNEEVQRAIFRAFLEGGYRVKNGLTTVNTPDGERHYLNNAFGVIADGLHLRTWGTARDVTEQRLLEERLEMVEKLEAVGRLAGGITHDFNNLLTAIIGNLELALDERGEPQRELIKVAIDAATRSASLTQRLLGLARRRPAQVDSIALEPFFSVIEPVLGQLPGSRQLSVEVAESLAVRADPVQL